MVKRLCLMSHDIAFSIARVPSPLRPCSPLFRFLTAGCTPVLAVLEFGLQQRGPAVGREAAVRLHSLLHRRHVGQARRAGAVQQLLAHVL